MNLVEERVQRRGPVQEGARVGCAAAIVLLGVDGQMRTLTVEDLQAVPKGALIRYRCQMDDAVWYESVEQVLQGVSLSSVGPNEAHYCPFCDDLAWPSGYLVVTVSRYHDFS
jgi:hypothetical protein